MTSSKIGIDTKTGSYIELPKSSRRQGLYIIGANGTGKSTLLTNLILADIHQNTGCAVLDPHGDLIDDVLSRIEKKDEEKVIYLDCQKNFFFGLNLYHCPDPNDSEIVLRTFEQVEHVFELLWGRDIEIATRPDLSQAIRNTAYSFIYNSDTQYQGCGLVELPLLFEEDIPRENITQALYARSDRLFSYWNRFNNLSPTRQEYFSQMLVSRSERFILNNLVRYIVGQSKTTINFREVMDQGLILLVKLPGNFEDTTELLGSMVVAEILSAALSRNNIPQNKRRQFNIYCDEFQRFATPDFHRLLTECRKYAQAITISHQARDFIDLKNKAATLQAANIAVFRVTGKDAAELASSFNCEPIPGEVRKEFKRTPVSDPIDYIVSGHTHPVHVVNEFCLRFRDLVRDAHLSPREAEQDTVEARQSGRRRTIIQREGRYEGNEEKVDLSRKTLNMLNHFLYEDVMLAKDERAIVPKQITWFIALWCTLPFFNIKQSGKGLYDYISILDPLTNGYFTYQPSETLIKTYVVLWYCLDEELQDVFSWYEKEARDALQQYYTYLIPQYFKTLYEFFYFRDEYGRPVFKDGTPSEKYPNFSKKAEVWEQDMGFQALIIPFHQLSFERRTESNGSSWWHLKPGTLELHLDNLVLQEVDHIIATMYPSFESFVKEVRAVIKALAKQPIVSSSGVEEIHTQEIPSHEVKDRIANELTRLEKHHAKVRIHGVSDKLEEYTIETEKPGNGINGQALEERKRRILQNMLAKGIYRTKKDIEEEIRKRHLLLRQSSRKPDKKTIDVRPPLQPSALQPEKKQEDTQPMPKRSRHIDN